MGYNASSNTCRACLLSKEEMLVLFDVYENDLSLATILRKFLGVELNSYDDLPNKLCQDCATILIKFYNFSVIFEDNNKKLLSLLSCPEEFQNGLDDEDDYICYSQFEMEQNIVLDNCSFNIDNIKYEEDEIQSCNDITEEKVGKREEFETYEHLKSEQIIVESDVFIKDNLCKAEVRTQKICKFCKKTFKNMFLYKRHVKCHFQGKKFVCEVCGYNSKKKAYLLDHMEMHATKKPYKCGYCSKFFKRRSVFSRHKRIHTNPKQIVCEVCGKAFTDKGNLKTHMVLHSKVRNFFCIVCSQSFALKSTLDKHLRRHQQKECAKKDFTCPECAMQYFDKSSLNRHYITKHSSKSVKQKCQNCDKEYTTKSNLFKHVQRHHKNIAVNIL